MKILGIETSCDETAASIAESEKDHISIRSNVISSQIDIHKQYGGVVPEVAAREHVLQILPVIDEAFKQGKITFNKQNKPNIDAIAVASGPGLITSLISGIETAKSLSYAWDIPLIKVNHIEGHIYANFIKNNKIEFPALILTVSGGHTILALMEEHGKYKTIGETRDDAAGEAFDKSAKLMNLGYPGGPIISKYAEKYKNQLKIENRKSKISLPRPMINSNNFDFSFSGLKTAIRYELEKDPDWQNRIPEYCYEFQQAVIDVLVYKTIKAGKKYQVKSVMLAGGVSANKELRTQLEFAVKDKLAPAEFFMPELNFTTDNAAMIACAGYFKAMNKEYTPWQEIKADCNLEL